MTRLRALNGGNEPPVSGRELLERVAPIIERDLPLVPRDDPYWLVLDRLARSSRARRGRAHGTPNGRNGR